MTDIRTIAEQIAATLRAEGVTVTVEHSTNSVGHSSYIFAAATNGKRFARFGARVSDHAVGSTRYEADQGRVQHYAQIGDDMAAFEAKLSDIARRATLHVGAQ
ncbi:hypothetical protein [Xanthobacter agilis]|uniref:Glucuronate isomerase n=1 Tax=Xanthobacter agilis TaxID=47492 RepID=A0ABU0LJY0_XANAG|nr:hypothetical protein [Xanthobacter agilis]MDQ0507441.1 glucuronate isomerase [Xanthobacter agilis]